MTSALLLPQLFLEPATEVDPFKIEATLQNAWNSFRCQQGDRTCLKLCTINFVVFLQFTSRCPGFGL